MKLIHIFDYPNDFNFIDNLLTSFEVEVSQIENEDNGTINSVIYNIYAQALRNAGLDLEDFEIDANSVASGLYYRQTSEKVTNKEDLDRIANAYK